MVEMFTVWERSPPVPTMSSVRPGTSMRTACASIVSARPGSSATDSPLVLSPSRNAAILGVEAAPLMISDMAHDVWLGREVPPCRERGEQVGPRGRGGAVRHRVTADDSTSRRDGPVELDRVEGAADDGVGVRPGGEPGVLRASGEHERGRAPEDLVLELTCEPEATDLVGLAVEDQQVERARLGLGDDGGRGGHLDPLDVRGAAPEPTTDREPHLGAGVDVVAVQKDPRAGGGGSCVLGLRRAHGRSLTRRRRASVGILARLVPRGGQARRRVARTHSTGPTTRRARRAAGGSAKRLRTRPGRLQIRVIAGWPSRASLRILTV